MKYEVEMAVGFDHGTWESFFVDVDVDVELDEADPSFTRAIEAAAEEKLDESMEYNKDISFTKMLYYAATEE